MHSEYLKAASPNRRPIAGNHSDLQASTHLKQDTRRFAAIFPVDATSADCGDASHEEQNDSDDVSRFEFVLAIDNNASTSQVASVSGADQNSTLSAAQQIIARYRAVRGSDHTRECPTTETGDKSHPQIPDDQLSMYTLAAPLDTKSTMDMMWRPKPKVHMHRTDQRALIQAQSQAIAMMNDAGLKPTNKIQCRRRGCADILPDVEALKYHLHIHNIAESASKCEEPSSLSARKPSSLLQRSIPSSKLPNRNNSCSKYSVGMQHRRSKTFPLPREVSAGSLPPLFSPRQGTPEATEVPSLMTVAKALTAGSSISEPAGIVRDFETPSVHTSSTPPRSRRQRKENITAPAGAECSPSIAMLLSPPPSPTMRGRFMLSPDAKFHAPVALGPVKDSKSENCISTRKDNAFQLPEQLMGTRSPVRALSPARAMSPIRDGIKRILSIRSDIVSDK